MTDAARARARRGRRRLGLRRAAPPGGSATSTRRRPPRGGREGGAHARRRRARARARTAAVLEPPAFAELLVYFAYDAFGALGLVEERSYAFGRLGEQVFDERFSLADDALDPRGLPKAFDFEGTPKQRVELVEDGVAHRRRLGPHDRQARRRRAARRPATRRRARCATGARCRSRSRSPAARRARPRSWPSSSATGSTSRASTTSASSTRARGSITGMTRDGTFRIRGGKIAEPLVNLRFTVSVPRAAGRPAGPDPRAGAAQPERLLRRALPDGDALAGGRDGALRRHRRRLRPGVWTRAVVDRAELVLAPAAQARRDQPRVGDPRDRDDELAPRRAASAPRAAGTARRGARSSRRCRRRRPRPGRGPARLRPAGSGRRRASGRPAGRSGPRRLRQRRDLLAGVAQRDRGRGRSAGRGRRRSSAGGASNSGTSAW